MSEWTAAEDTAHHNTQPFSCHFMGPPQSLDINKMRILVMDNDFHNKQDQNFQDVSNVRIYRKVLCFGNIYTCII